MPDTLLRWATALVQAVDTDNIMPSLTCAKASTLERLKTAPEPLTEHASLSLGDFTKAASQELTGLRSDAVANRLTISEGHPNLVVGRMTVPGGPWPGHFGLEAVVFDAEPASMPASFPPLSGAQSGAFRLHFGRIVAASRGFRDGSGVTLFPEQFAVQQRPARQAFGVVFLDKLIALFRDQVLPVLDLSGVDTDPTAPENETSERKLRKLRRLAFLAHEWGHLAGPTTAQAVRRLVAVASELHADLAALTMLLSCPAPWAEPVARVLVADRIVREAWLRRPYAQVDAIAARQLLALLTMAGAARLGPDGRLLLDLRAAKHAAAEELGRVRVVEQACYADLDGPKAARDYLRAHGWTLVDAACHRELEDPLARFLSYAATDSGRSMLTGMIHARASRCRCTAAGLPASP